MTHLHDWIVGSVSIGVGVLACAAAVFNWEWCFQLRKAQFVESYCGRSGARFASAMLGLALIALGLGIVTDSIPRLGRSGARSGLLPVAGLPSQRP